MLTYSLQRCIHVLVVTALVLAVTINGPILGLAAQEASPISATPEASSGVVFHATADAHVMRDEPDENFGGEATLLTDKDPYAITYIRFDVSSTTSPITNAVLRIWIVDTTNRAPTVWLAPDAPWSESEVTWNTRPALDWEIEGNDEESIPEGDWLEYDVSAVVSGNGAYTFVLVPESNNGLTVNAREADEHQPELTVETGDRDAVQPMPSSDEPIILAAGDIAGCDTDGDEQTAKILDEQDGIVATLGDAVYEKGTTEEFEECYGPTWGRHKERTMPALGNHEWLTDEAAPYHDYFGSSAGEHGKGYYSYDVGGWHVVVLNTNIDHAVGSEQERWLRQDLEAHPSNCTLAYWHHPRFSSGTHGSNPDVGGLYTALYEHGAEIVLSGHDHDYERFAPQDPTGELDPVHGIRQFVVGTGGIDLRPFGPPRRNSEVRSSHAYGILRIELHDNSYRWEFLAVEGASFYDSGTGQCHDAPDAVATPVASPSAIMPATSLVRSHRRFMARLVRADRLRPVTRESIPGRPKAYGLPRSCASPSGRRSWTTSQSSRARY